MQYSSSCSMSHVLAVMFADAHSTEQIPMTCFSLRCQVTPFLLERIRDLTGGASLAANIKLVLNNAAIGAKIAVEYAQKGRSLEQANNGSRRSRL